MVLAFYFEKESKNRMENGKLLITKVKTYCLYSSISALISAISIFFTKNLMTKVFVDTVKAAEEHKLLKDKLGEDDLKAKEIKINYPLYLKKVRSNIFSRVKKSDFRNEEPPKQGSITSPRKKQLNRRLKGKAHIHPLDDSTFHDSSSPSIFTF